MVSSPAAPPVNDAGLSLTYYGDDFTGSTDVLEALTLGGIPTVLFLDVPTPEQVAHYPHAAAVGVAGISRTMTPEQAGIELPPVLSGLARLRAPLFHYKVCSTFDSSPSLGSIGRAAELVREAFPGSPLPLVVGVPVLGRYTAFGTLFAKFRGKVYRLDRHPTMTVHPATPMTESDLLVHLAEQTDLSSALVDVTDLAGDAHTVDARVDEVMGSGADIVLFDVLDGASERQVGRTLDRLVRARFQATGSSLAVLGSSGVEYALRTAWRGTSPEWSPAGDVAPPSQTLVIAGSRAAATDAQVAHALAAGFANVPVDPVAVTDPLTGDRARARVTEAAVTALADGGHVLVRTPPKSASAPVDGTTLARALGDIAAAIGRRHPIRRLVVAGGDTSGLVARALGIEALELIAPLAPGAPLCRASGRHRGHDGLEVCLKAGQIGEPDYFVRVAEYGPAHPSTTSSHEGRNST